MSISSCTKHYNLYEDHCYKFLELAKSLKSHHIAELFYKLYPKCEGHVHGEALIRSKRYFKYLAYAKCYYNPVNKVFESQKTEGNISAQEAIATKRAEIEDLMSMAGRPQLIKPSDYFFDNICKLIDSLNELMPFHLQLFNMLLELISQKHTNATIIIDLPMFLKQPSEPALKALDELFQSREFLNLKPYHPQLRLDPDGCKKLKEGMEPLLKKAFEIVKKELFPIYRNMMDSLIKAEKIVMEKLRFCSEKIPFNKILYPIMRGESHASFFFKTLYVFYHLRMNKDFIRGYQLVGSEFAKSSKDNFLVEMFIIEFCHRRFGHSGNIVLHAGELLENMIQEMPNQVHLSAHLGLKDRPKKVVALSHVISATDAELDELKKFGICVEVCLTSNELLLGISPKKHLIHRLLHKRIPFTLSTDDPQHFNITLSNELVKALMNYGLNYFDIKNCFRNKFHYSADLEGFSLYEEDPDHPGMLKLIAPFDRIETFDNTENILLSSKKAREAYKWELQVFKYEREVFQNCPEQLHKLINSNIEILTKELGGFNMNEKIVLEMAGSSLLSNEGGQAEMEQLNNEYLELLDQEDEISAKLHELSLKEEKKLNDYEKAKKMKEDGIRIYEEGIKKEQEATKMLEEAERLERESTEKLQAMLLHMCEEEEVVEVELNKDNFYVPVQRNNRK